MHKPQGFANSKLVSDLSNYCALPGQYSFVFTQRLGSAFSMHIQWSYDHVCRAYTKYFRFLKWQSDLLVVCACSLTACETASLLVGCSFVTSTVPNLKFPNYDSACERSYYHTEKKRGREGVCMCIDSAMLEQRWIEFIMLHKSRMYSQCVWELSCLLICST